MEKYSGLLYTLCRRYCYKQMDARDVLQDALLTIFKNFHQYDVSKGLLDNWLKKVTINVALQHNRSQKVFTIDLDEEAYKLESKDENPIDNLSADEIIALIAKLSENQGHWWWCVFADNLELTLNLQTLKRQS